MGKGKRNRNRGTQGPAPARQPQPRVHTVDPRQDGAPAMWNPQSQILQQLGLHQPGGVMRLVTILMHHFDPEGKGVVIDELALAGVMHRAVEEGRSQLQISGQPNALFLQMVTEEEARMFVQTDNALARQQGRPEAQLPPEGQQP